jgi:hypothetical protein
LGFSSLALADDWMEIRRKDLKGKNSGNNKMKNTGTYNEKLRRSVHLNQNSL